MPAGRSALLVCLVRRVNCRNSLPTRSRLLRTSKQANGNVSLELTVKGDACVPLPAQCGIYVEWRRYTAGESCDVRGHDTAGDYKQVGQEKMRTDSNDVRVH